jgi:hypothetical protein
MVIIQKKSLTSYNFGMKTIYILLILLFMAGCADKNAFSHFDLSKEQELSAQSFNRIKITDNESVIGTFSSIYLNEIYPKRFNGDEYFLVYVYMKDPESKYTFKLNSKNYLKIKKLEHYNRFTKLIRQSSRWSKYYLVSFEEHEGRLNLELHSDNSKLASISYIKNKH